MTFVLTFIQLTSFVFIKINMNNGIVKDIEFIENVECSSLSTIKTKENFVKGVFYPKTEKELINVYDFLKEENSKFVIVGNGSNILFSNKSKDYIVLSTKKLKQNIKIKDNFLFCPSSIMLSSAFHFACKHGLMGLEYLANIPGTIGGAIMMNAGAFGKNIFDMIEYVKIYSDKKIKYLKANQIEHGYRFCNLQDSLILSCKLKLTKEEPSFIYKNYLTYSLIRRDKQPSGCSFGSTFKNPPSFSAGFLIDSCGLKGVTHNGAKISEKHANFIINEKNATFNDIEYLINLCQQKVYENFGITLEKEIIII